MSDRPLDPPPDPADLLDDDALLAALGGTLEVLEPVPAWLVAAAAAAPSLAALDAELLELEELEATAGVRGTGHRDLVLRSGSVQGDLRLEPTADGWRGIGHLDTPASEVRLEAGSDVVVAPVDAYGSFTFERVAPGFTRIVVVADGERRVGGCFVA